MSLRCSLDFVRTIALLVLVAAAMPASSADGQPANPPVASDADDASAHFRVDMHAERDGQRYVMRRYVDGPRSRMEAEVDGQKMVIIDLGDAQGTTYMLMPTMKRAMKSSTASLQANSGGGNDGTPTPEQAEAAVELLGTERLGGKTAEKYRVTMPEGTGLMWIEASTQLPLRMEAEGMAVEMKDYNFSRPSRELFEVPKGYDLLDMDQMLKSAGGVGGANVGSLQSLVAGMVGGQAGAMGGMPGGLGGMPGLSGMAGLGMAGGLGGMTGGLGGRLGGQFGGQLGAGIGGALGGPIGAMVGRYLGRRIGQKLGQRAGRALVPK